MTNGRCMIRKEWYRGTCVEIRFVESAGFIDLYSLRVFKKKFQFVINLRQYFFDDFY